LGNPLVADQPFSQPLFTVFSS